MKRAIAAYHEKHLREYIERGARMKGEERRGVALELFGYLAACYGICPHCGAAMTREHYCIDMARIDETVGRAPRAVVEV